MTRPDTDYGSVPRDADTIVNFIYPSGEVIAQRVAADLPLPSVGDQVTFGRIEAGDGGPEYQMSEEAYTVVGVEYDYPTPADEVEDETDVAAVVAVEVEAVEE